MSAIADNLDRTRHAIRHGAGAAADDRAFAPPSAPILTANLAALWLSDPALARELEFLPDDAAYPVELTPAGVPTVAVTDPAGRRVYLHSRHQPVGEASRMIAGIEPGDHLAYYIHGTGLGFHLELLFDRSGPEAVFCVFEPDLRMICTAFAHSDLSRLIRSRRVIFVTRPEKTELMARLQPHSTFFGVGAATVAHAPSERLHPEFHRQTRQAAEEYAAYLRTSLSTLVLNSRLTAENIARNLGWYAAAPSLDRLRGRYRGSPAVIVSAGPSLRKNKHLLKGLEDNAVIVAVQTTLQPLLEMGVEPHFVTSLDYHSICSRFFEKLPASLRTELVAEAKATDLIFDLHPGPLSLLGNDFAEGMLRELKLNKTKLPAGATVAHLAFYLAEHLGCDPIILVGQDLGFGDGLCYAPGTSYEDVWRPETSRFCTAEMKQWEQVVRDRPILRRVPDQDGRPMYTEERLFTYLQQFERDFAKTAATVIDATEGGARKRGATPMRLADAVEAFCAAPLPRVADDHPGAAWDRAPDVLRSLRLRAREAAEVRAVAGETLPLLEDIRDHLRDQPRVNRAIARVDALRTRMNGLGPCYDLILQLTQQTELSRFRADKHLAASGADGFELQRRQVQRDVDNARAVRDAAAAFEAMVAATIDRLAARHPRARAREGVAA